MNKIRKYIVFIFIFSILISSAFSSKAANVSWPNGPDISSAAGIVIDASTGTILYSKNCEEEHYPASITKLMTVLLVLENCSMDEVVTFSKNAVFGIEAGSSNIGINVGEKLTIEQCLYGILLASANEVSYAVGEYVGDGDINKFVDMMNQKAKDLGCKNTHFCNPHGLHNNDHYTCPYDMALITKELLKYDTFRIISGSARYVLPPTNLQEESRYLNNTHKMLTNAAYYFDGVEGGKTGFTDQALNTLVTYAKRDNLEVIVVTMYGNQTHYSDTATLLNFVFDNFKSLNVSKNETVFSNSNNDFLENNNGFFNYLDSPIIINNSDYIVLPIDADFSDANASLSINNSNDGASYLEYTYNDIFIGRAEIKLAKNVHKTFDFNKKSSNWFTFRTLIAIIITLIIILILILIIRKLYQKRKYKRRFITKKTNLKF